MIQGGREPSGYQSYCPSCGQKNYKKVLPAAESPEDEVQELCPDEELVGRERVP